ncbi:uncharacterized transmembrane protein DDB_G0289901 [Copidosoma floridanum]|uniref:uncharacterized transmembrane protein DDB_G0289901 n=1 Tax=Copidosoma floridanum TaxID=29053 RepID=UPI000C6FA9E8|nr:uncharacterized transmembrane protein DDB_G0289901 [Copidosoma floridanum]
MDSSVGKSTGSGGNTSGSGVSGSASSGNSGSGNGPASSSGNVPNSSSSSSSSADGGDIYEFKSSKEATPVRGSSSSPNLNPDKDGKDSNSSLALSTSNTQNLSSAAPEPNATSQGSAVVGSSTGVSSSVSSTNAGAITGSSCSSTGGTSGTLAEAMSTSTTDDQPQSSSASGTVSGASSTSVKRSFDSESGPGDEQDEEGRKRKKKETETGKDVGAKGPASRQATPRNNPSASDKIKQTCSRQVGGIVNTKGNQGNNSSSSDRKSPSMSANSPKPSNSSISNTNNLKGNTPSATESDGEDERSKNSDSNSAPKVPPLKIVIPQSTVSEQEQGNRNGKNNSNRGHQLPYVVASSNSNDSTDKEQGMSVVTSGTTSPIDNGGASSKTDEKKEMGGALDGSNNGPWHSHQRVLRSSHRSGNGANGSSGSNSGNMSGNGNFSNNSPLPANPADRSNNSSPQQRYHSPTPESVVSEAVKTASADSSIQNSPAPKSSSVIDKGDVKVEVKKELVDSSEVNIKKEPGSESSNTSSQQSVELHPRKRKMKPNKENQQSTSSSTGTNETTETTNTVPEIHPHDQPITNCYQLFLNIRKQIDKKRKGLFPVQPKPPQGFKDYLMNRCTYVLAGNANKEPTINFPVNLPAQMKDLYVQQEQVRHRLRMQHVVEKEKLVLSVEQEILRVHGKAARALANQSLPFSACTFLKDEEVYNVITPEQEEKDRNARSRYNGRLFLSWLQDVDDKWEKIKEGMLLRHHNEAESLHAVQRMDWEWKLKEVQLCEFKATPQIEDSHVPMVHVSDDFDLLPA